MKTLQTRHPLHKQSPEHSEQPFFNKNQNDKKDGAFFQTKLSVGEKDDKHEKEANKVADNVQKKAEEKEKPGLQKKEEGIKEAAVQKMSKVEEEKPVQKMSAGEKKDEKMPVNKKGLSDKEEKVMKKEASGTHAAHKVSLEQRIRQSKGKGQTLPDKTRTFMETELGADFGEVVIHTDSEAIAMNKELNALAFTNGFDIYFNAGQYQPDSKSGQNLLAHELTHVIQQTGVSRKKNKK